MLASYLLLQQELTSLHIGRDVAGFTNLVTLGGLLIQSTYQEGHGIVVSQ